MTIEQLSSTKVLISLCSEDMEDFSLRFDTMGLDNDSSRKVIMRLLSLACNKTGMSIGGNTVLVEALPHQSGCLLLVTLMDKNRGRRVYKVKRIEEYPCYLFEDAQSLLNGMERLKNRPFRLHSNTLWLYEGSYRLLFDYPVVPAGVRMILSEYSKEQSISAPIAARIRECGKLLCAGSAVDTIGSLI